MEKARWCKPAGLFFVLEGGGRVAGALSIEKPPGLLDGSPSFRGLPLRGAPPPPWVALDHHSGQQLEAGITTDGIKVGLGIHHVSEVDI